MGKVAGNKLLEEVAGTNWLEEVRRFDRLKVGSLDAVTFEKQVRVIGTCARCPQP